MFSSDCGSLVASEELKAVAREVGDKWMELAIELDMDTDDIPHNWLGTLQCQRMLEKWVKKWGDDAMICVLCDALYARGLKHVADEHFGHILDTVLRKQTSTQHSKQQVQYRQVTVNDLIDV